MTSIREYELRNTELSKLHHPKRELESKILCQSQYERKSDSRDELKNKYLRVLLFQIYRACFFGVFGPRVDLFGSSSIWRRLRQSPNFPRQLKSLRRRTSVSVKSLNMDPRSTAVSRVLRYLGNAFVWGLSSGGSRRGTQDRDLQHGGNFTDTRNDKAFADEFAALQHGPCEAVMIAG